MMNSPRLYSAHRLRAREALYEVNFRAVNQKIGTKSAVVVAPPARSGVSDGILFTCSSKTSRERAESHSKSNWRPVRVALYYNNIYIIMCTCCLRQIVLQKFLIKITQTRTRTHNHFSCCSIGRASEKIRVFVYY